MAFFDKFKKKKEQPQNMWETSANANSENPFIIGDENKPKPANGWDQGEYVRYDASGAFVFGVEDAFTIMGRGTVVTGTVLSGTAKTGDQAIVRTKTGQEIQTSITGMEKFKELVNVAQPGDHLGMILSGISRGQVKGGDQVIVDHRDSLI